MIKLAYLECPTGIAGDMCLGALVHAGVPLEYLVEQLGRLGMGDQYRLWAERVLRNGQQATKVHVELLGVDPSLPPEAWEATFRPYPDQGTDSLSHSHTPDHASDHSHNSDHHHHHQAQQEQDDHDAHDHTHEHEYEHKHKHDYRDAVATAAVAAHPPQGHGHHHTRHLPEIEQLIQSAQLPPKAEQMSLAVFRQLANAEGAVHGIAPEQVHFHEVGATDAIVDIVGTCLGLDWLGIDALYCSPLPTGGGTVRAAHGRMPVPTPAVLKLWEMRQVPIYSNGIDRELVTPTGAAIAITLATAFGPPPSMTLQRVGLGAGSQNLALPNILRLWLGQPTQPTPLSTRYTDSPSPPLAHSPTLESITVLETQIDDLSPQVIGYTMERLFAIGALDVFTQPIGMKKNRPGILLTVICRPETAIACETVLFQETTTLGVRRLTQQRSVLHREIHSVETPLGTVRIKVAWDRATGDRQLLNAQPEYEDCARLAQQYHRPWQAVHGLALQCWQAHGMPHQPHP